MAQTLGSNSQEIKKVTIYTDGACSGNPGPGGWGVVMIYQDKVKTFSGFTSHTTNNRMEISAVIEALKLLKTPCEVELYTDSNYVVNAIGSWIAKWKRNNWYRDKKNLVLNIDLWQNLDELLAKHKVLCYWVPSHSGNKYNEIADSLARNAIKK